MWSTLILGGFLLLAQTASGNQNFGDCSDLDGRELIWQYNVRRTPSVMTFQTVEAQYRTARAIISCIDVTWIGQDRGMTRITSGGVGTNHVNFEFVTTRGKSMNVKVLVYGQ